jgi:two-component system chemotaxis response regulator CheB
MAKRPPHQPIRVLIVEDSRAQRELLIRLLQSAGIFDVVGAVDNGRDAVEYARRLRPDVIAMDIHLPIFDGYEATRQIMQCCATPIVMVSSSIGDAGRRSVEALAAGALAVIRKPGHIANDKYEDDRVNLVKTLQIMADVPVVTRHTARLTAAPSIETTAAPWAEKPRRVDVLAIAASTGGPAAVQMLLGGLGASFPLPILLVQHIANGFVEALVDWLNATLPFNVRIASHGETMQSGTVYLAPDDYHLVVERPGVVGLKLHGPLDRYCPSADTLFDSVTSMYGKQAIGVIMTGMGDDGARGLRALRLSGGQTFAQDEASCVVYGMPHAAVEMGAVSQTEPLTHMAKAILEYAQIATIQTKQ